jgi:cell division protein FtsI (penicillin-binding protein 3)
LHVAVLVLVALVAFRLVSVQVLDRDRYEAFGEDQRLQATELPAGRGAVLDRDGDVLAVSHDRPTVYADPATVTNPEAAAAALAPVLDLDAGDLAAELSQPTRFVYIKRLITDDEAAAVTELDIEGVGLVDEPVRARPNGDLARSLLGSVNDYHEALGGLELFYDDVLAGEAGDLVVERNQEGLSIPGGRTQITPPTPGQDLILSIDREAQWFAEELVADQVDTTGAAGGFAVVMNTATGELLAVASADAGEDGAPAAPSGGSRAYHDSYEPGSVSKVFTIAGAIEEGTVTPEQWVEVPYHYQFSDKLFTEPYAHGDQTLTVTEVLAKSSNIGTIRIAETIGPDKLYGYLSGVGFGTRTGVDGAEAFPGEQAGTLWPTDEWRGTTLATVAFGQGITVTGIQLAAAYNTIANDGRYVPPVLVTGVRNADGTVEQLPRPEARRVFSEETAATVARMLEHVVTEGTGTRASVAGYRVAGKTGTAQKVDPNTGQYSASAHVATFAGFVPAEDPALTIVVVLDEPRSVHVAGLVAAPLFADLAHQTLQTLRIAPSPAEPAVAAE